MELFILILELAGTAAFALSGAMLALKKNMDLFGVCVMGLTTACGGGVVRDILLGALPPVMFRQPIYALTALCVSLVAFLPAVRKALTANSRAYVTTILFADSAGLAIFTCCAGVAAAVNAGYGDNFFFSIFLGTVTGVGGGVMRDILAGMPPYIFIKHVYACAALAGAILCAALWVPAGSTAAMLSGSLLVFLLRLLAAHFRWNFPRPGADAGAGP